MFEIPFKAGRRRASHFSQNSMTDGIPPSSTLFLWALVDWNMRCFKLGGGGLIMPGTVLSLNEKGNTITHAPAKSLAFILEPSPFKPFTLPFWPFKGRDNVKAEPP